MSRFTREKNWARAIDETETHLRETPVMFS